MTLRVAVRLTPGPDGLGEWLADASAYDAAGADSLWVELGPEPLLDPLVLIAALAVVTSRSQLVLSVDDLDLSSAERTRTLDTVRQLSRRRLTLLATADRCQEIVDTTPDVAVLARGQGPIEAESRGASGSTERWLSAQTPQDRASWLETCTQAAAREAAGLVVDADPVLFDILRNPNPTGDRRDLNVASG